MFVIESLMWEKTDEKLAHARLPTEHWQISQSQGPWYGTSKSLSPSGISLVFFLVWLGFFVRFNQRVGVRLTVLKHDAGAKNRTRQKADTIIHLHLLKKQKWDHSCMFPCVNQALTRIVTSPSILSLLDFCLFFFPSKRIDRNIKITYCACFPHQMTGCCYTVTYSVQLWSGVTQKTRSTAEVRLLVISAPTRQTEGERPMQRFGVLQQYLSEAAALNSLTLLGRVPFQPASERWVI